MLNKISNIAWYNKFFNRSGGFMRFKVAELCSTVAGDGKNEHYMTLKSDMRETSILGVFSKDENDDIDLLVNHFSAPALARALREREAILQMVAKLVNNEQYELAEELLYPYQEASIRKRRMRNGEKPVFNSKQPLNKNSLIMIQRALQRRPRQVYQGSEKRASVVIPLCNVNGVASVLFQRRSATVSTYKNQVCFPGGMVDDEDKYIVETSLRELYEELAIQPEQTEVLGILRCNWTEVENITGIAVTPVVGYMGEYSALHIQPNKDEVDELFTVPLHVLMDEAQWELKPNAAPVFKGGAYVIWGLTAYLTERFVQDILKQIYTFPDQTSAKH